jgi:hypothetical protein
MRPRDPITASSRPRSPGPSRTSMPFPIQPDSHIGEPTGIIRQRLSTSDAHPDTIFVGDIGPGDQNARNSARTSR